MATWGACPTGSDGASGEVSALRYVSGAVGCARGGGQLRCEQSLYAGDRRKETHNPNGELFLCLVLDFFHVGQVDLAELAPGLVLVARRREGYIVVRGLDGQVGRCWFRSRVGRQRRSDVGALVGDLASEGRVGRAKSQTADGCSQSCGKHSVFLSWRSMRRGTSESAGKVGNAKIRSSRVLANCASPAPLPRSLLATTTRSGCEVTPEQAIPALGHIEKTSRCPLL